MVKIGQKWGGAQICQFSQKFRIFFEKKSFFSSDSFFSPKLEEETPYVADTVSQRRCLVGVSFARSSMPSISLFTSVSQHTFKHVHSPGFLKPSKPLVFLTLERSKTAEWFYTSPHCGRAELRRLPNHLGVYLGAPVTHTVRSERDVSPFCPQGAQPKCERSED